MLHFGCLQNRLGCLLPTTVFRAGFMWRRLSLGASQVWDMHGEKPCLIEVQVQRKTAECLCHQYHSNREATTTRGFTKASYTSCIPLNCFIIQAFYRLSLTFVLAPVSTPRPTNFSQLLFPTAGGIARCQVQNHSKSLPAVMAHTVLATCHVGGPRNVTTSFYHSVYVYYEFMIYICIYVYTHTYAHIHTYTYMYEYLHTCVYIYINTYLPTYIHTYIHTYRHIEIHRHT